MTHHRHPQTYEIIINTEFIDNNAIIENVSFSLLCLSIYRKLLLKRKERLVSGIMQQLLLVTTTRRCVQPSLK